MDDDQLTQQRAMDAAAAVAVAAAAAAHQTQNQHQLKRDRQKSDLDQNELQDTRHDLDGHEIVKIQGEDETFADDSMQYVQSDMNGQNGNVSHLEGVPSTSTRSIVHHTKRRKVNTCLPCKRRKVKCDREKPYCGQCKKHNFPASECTWSTAIVGPSPVRRRKNSDAASEIDAVADAAAAAVTSASTSTPGSQWYEMSSAPWANFPPLAADQTSQALASRIVELEAANTALAATRSVDLNGDAQQHTTVQWEEKGSTLSEAQRGMAADALTMIAQHESLGNTSTTSDLPATQAISYKGRRLLPSSSTSIPAEVLTCYERTANSRTKEIVSLLPDMATIRLLIADLSTMEDYGLNTGINSELLSYQVDILQLAAEGAEGLPMDLTLIALLFYALALSLVLKDDLTELDRSTSLPEIYEGDTVTFEDQDTKSKAAEIWSGAGQALLSILEYQEDPNLNILTALSLKHQYLNALKRFNPARYTLLTALSLCNWKGILDIASDAGRSVDLRADSAPGFAPNLAAQSPILLQNAAGSIYRSLVSQYNAPEEQPLVQFTFDFTAAGLTADNESNFSTAMFEMTRDYDQARQADSDLQALGEKWGNLAILLGEGQHNDSSTDSITRTHGKAVAIQWAILRMHANHRLNRIRRQRSMEVNVQSAYRVLHYRYWLEEQRPVVFKIAKIPALQLMTLESAIVVTLWLMSKGQSEEAREELVKAIGCLSTGGQRQTTAQKMLQYLLSQADGNGLISDDLQDESIIFTFLTQVCSNVTDRAQEALFWKEIRSRGANLLDSS